MSLFASKPPSPSVYSVNTVIYIIAHVWRRPERWTTGQTTRSSTYRLPEPGDVPRRSADDTVFPSPGQLCSYSQVFFNSTTNQCPLGISDGFLEHSSVNFDIFLKKVKTIVKTENMRTRTHIHIQTQRGKDRPHTSENSDHSAFLFYIKTVSVS